MLKIVPPDPASPAGSGAERPGQTPLAPPEEARELSAKTFPGPVPAFAVRAALHLRRSLLRLADAVVPAQYVLFEMATGLSRTELLGTAARYRVADQLDGGAKSAEELAPALGASPQALHRTLRGLSALGVFRLRRDGRFENNRLSRALRSGQLGRAREWIEYYSSASNRAAWADLDETVRLGRSAFERVHGMSVWEWFDRHPDEREMFAQAMMGLTVADAPVVASLYPFAEVRRLCDVGGGRGTLLSEILLRHRHLQGVLYDGPGVIESARVLLARRGVAERVETVAGSFFDSVPGGCDAYLMKHVLHDWDDERCLQVLRNCRRAMGSAGGRLILAELIVEKNETRGIGPQADLQMLIVCSDGRERSRSEFAELLSAAGFRLGRVFPYPTVSVLEALPV